jgi:flagellar M-ring protein FliF
VRPLVRRIIAPATDGIQGLLPSAAAVAEAGAAAAETEIAFKAEPSQTSKMIDIAQIQGQVHAQSVQKVGEIAERNPHETVSIIRQWLHENAA